MYCRCYSDTRGVTGQSLEQTLRILLHQMFKSFFDVLRASEEVVHEHMTVNVIASMTHLMAIKSKFSFSRVLLNLISDVLPMNHKMLKDMYQ
jgi:hypothetical protein